MMNLVHCSRCLKGVGAKSAKAEVTTTLGTEESGHGGEVGVYGNMQGCALTAPGHLR